MDSLNNVSMGTQSRSEIKAINNQNASQLLLREIAESEFVPQTFRLRYEIWRHQTELKSEIHAHASIQTNTMPTPTTGPFLTENASTFSVPNGRFRWPALK